MNVYHEFFQFCTHSTYAIYTTDNCNQLFTTGGKNEILAILALEEHTMSNMPNSTKSNREPIPFLNPHLTPSTSLPHASPSYHPPLFLTHSYPLTNIASTSSSRTYKSSQEYLQQIAHQSAFPPLFPTSPSIPISRKKTYRS